VSFSEKLFGFYKSAMNLRTGRGVLQTGGYKALGAFDREQTFAFLREQGKEALLIALNRSDEAQTVDVKVPADTLGRMGDKLLLFVTRGKTDEVKVESSDNGLKLTIPALTGVVIGAAGAK